MRLAALAMFTQKPQLSHQFYGKSHYNGRMLEVCILIFALLFPHLSPVKEIVYLETQGRDKEAAHYKVAVSRKKKCS